MNFKGLAKKAVYALNKNPISKYAYEKEINRRSKLLLTEIISLSQPINMFSPFTNELQPVNDWYGHATVLKKFLGLPNDYQFKFNLEHGTYLAEQIADVELESNLPSFVTYSPYRMNILKKISKSVYAIGPFIHYAPHFLNKQQLKDERKRLGKTLLFFPSHSIIGSSSKYDNEDSYKKIVGISKGFDTIRVCIYWKDVLLNEHKFYQSKGLECVSAGHILDPLFLPRVKSIIYNSDLVVSNDASSPLSYSIYMKKPHIIFYQRAKINNRESLKKIMNDYWRSKPYLQMIKEFSKIRFTISSQQQNFINYYLGTASVKSKKELLKIVEETENIFQNFKKYGCTK